MRKIINFLDYRKQIKSEKTLTKEEIMESKYDKALDELDEEDKKLLNEMMNE